MMVRRQLCYGVMLVVMAACFSIGYGRATAAQSEKNMVIDLVQDQIDVTTNFQGGVIELYGLKLPETDVIIVLRGPPRNMLIRQKEQTMLGWRYRKQSRLEAMSSFYSYASTRSPQEILPLNLMQDHEIGKKQIDLKYGKGEPEHSTEEIAAFKRGYLRNLEALHLLQPNPLPIRQIDPRLFRATFPLPHNAPIGHYVFEILHVKNKQITDVEERGFYVSQVGLNAKIKSFSKNSPFLYGLTCIALAIFAGFVSNRLKRAL